MADRRPRRLTRYVALTLAAVVVLPAAYVASAVSLTFAYAAGCVPDSLLEVVVPVYEPLSLYIDAEYPGAEPILWACELASNVGEELADR